MIPNFDRGNSEKEGPSRQRQNQPSRWSKQAWISDDSSYACSIPASGYQLRPVSGRLNSRQQINSDPLSQYKARASSGDPPSVQIFTEFSSGLDQVRALDVSGGHSNTTKLIFFIGPEPDLCYRTRIHLLGTNEQALFHSASKNHQARLGR